MEDAALASPLNLSPACSINPSVICNKLLGCNATSSANVYQVEVTVSYQSKENVVVVDEALLITRLVTSAIYLVGTV